MINRFSQVIALLIFAGGLLFVNAATSMASTAFMLSEGQHRYTTGVTYATAKDTFNQFRRRVPQGCTSRDISWHHSYTYGYSYYLNLFANGALSNFACGAQPKVTGVGDIQVGIRGRLDKFRNGRTWELATWIPTGYDNQRINRLGFGRFGIWGGVNWSTQNTGWEASMPSYWEMGTGIQYWFGSPATQSVSFLKWSWRLDEKGKNRIVLGSKLRLSFRDGTPQFPAALGGFPRFSNDFDQLRLYAKYSHRLSKHWTVSTTIGNTVWGRNISASWTGDLAVTYRWD